MTSTTTKQKSNESDQKKITERQKQKPITGDDSKLRKITPLFGLNWSEAPNFKLQTARVAAKNPG